METIKIGDRVSSAVGDMQGDIIGFRWTHDGRTQVRVRAHDRGVVAWIDIEQIAATTGPAPVPALPGSKGATPCV